MNRPLPRVLLTLLAWGLALGALPARAETAAAIPADLRGGIKADATTLSLARQMRADGWYYMMPRPKSPQAAWGNPDGRTTWWVGYWLNKKTKAQSLTTPTLKEGHYVGDGKGEPLWRRGGSPSRPTVLEWLLSESGGIPPAGS
jgi:hypothetical protein